MKSVLFAICAVAYIVVFANGVTAQTNNEKALRSRVGLFGKSFAAERYDVMWKMTSKTIRMSTPAKIYIDDLRKFRKDNFRSNIESVSIKRKKAVVTIQRCLILTGDTDWRCETTNDRWIIENGRWFYDGVDENAQTK
jgi:hypothetical protein